MWIPMQSYSRGFILNFKQCPLFSRLLLTTLAAILCSTSRIIVWGHLFSFLHLKRWLAVSWLGDKVNLSWALQMKLAVCLNVTALYKLKYFTKVSHLRQTNYKWCTDSVWNRDKLMTSDSIFTRPKLDLTLGNWYHTVQNVSYSRIQIQLPQELSYWAFYKMLVVFQLIKEFLTFFKPEEHITVIKTVHYWVLFWACIVQSTL